MLEKRQYVRERLDHIRTTLIHEPRGHQDMYGCILTPPVEPASDYGVLFMHNEGYSTMCGHGVIALVTALAENGMLRDPSRVQLDTPAGAVIAAAEIVNGRASSVTFQNVPSFVFERDLEVEGLNVDVVFGGAFYALVESPLPVDSGHLAELRVLGMRIKRGVERVRTVRHPLEADLEGIYGTIFTGPPTRRDAHLRNVTIFADAEVDRSPCGTGTCATMASRSARGLLQDGEDFVYESIVGTAFFAKILRRTQVGTFPAIVPSITGSAYVTGFHTFVVDSDDPVGTGFRL